MSATRCADPAYQLDVDVLMLEYLLHHAIKARFWPFDLVASKPEDNIENGNDGSSNSADAAQRSFNAFAIFYRQFHDTHPSQVLEPGTNFNVLLNEATAIADALGSRSVSAVDTALDLDAVEEIRDFKARRSRMQELTDERLLLANHLESGSTDALRQLITTRLLYGTSDYGNGPEYKSMPGSRPYSIFRLLNRFMALTARIIQQLPGQDINENWMDIAGKLILHAALEAISEAAHCDITGGVHDGGPRPGILDCFAFRRFKIDPRNIDATSSQDIYHDLETEEAAINDMFKPEAVSVMWEKIRSQYLSELVVPKVADTAGINDEDVLDNIIHSYANRVDRLRRKYPQEEAIESVVKCLQNLWTINATPSISGKPILVQIEEGGLEGLSQEEFDGFMERTGLKRTQEMQQDG